MLPPALTVCVCASCCFACASIFNRENAGRAFENIADMVKILDKYKVRAASACTRPRRRCRL